ENPFLESRHGTVCAGRRVGPIGGRTGLRLPSDDDPHLALARWAACSKLPRALFVSSSASLSAVGRIAHQVAQPQTRLVAVAGHRPPDEDPSRAPPGSSHATRSHSVIHSLRQILSPGCIPLFTSDGLNLYFSALTAQFGQWREVARRGRNVLQWQV